MYCLHLSGEIFPHLDDEGETCSPISNGLQTVFMKAFQRDSWKLAHLRENHKTQSISISYFLDLTLALNSLAERKGVLKVPRQKNKH